MHFPNLKAFKEQELRLELLEPDCVDDVDAVVNDTTQGGHNQEQLSKKRDKKPN